MKKKDFAVIGIGRFGYSLAVTLKELGHDVLAVDSSKEKIQDISEIVTHAVQADATDEDVLNDIGLRNFETVVVAIGQDVQASILTTLTLKEMGIKKVVAKALNDKHGRVLEKIGADMVIYPEKDMAQRLARHLVAHNFLDYIELSTDYGLLEMHPTEAMVGKTLKELNLRSKTGVSVIAIKKRDKVITAPGGEDIIEEGDVLVVIGSYKDFERLQD